MWETVQNEGDSMRAVLGSILLVTACGGESSLSPEETPASVTVSPHGLSLLRGETGSLSALVRNSLGNGIAYRVVWSSTNPTVATVSGAGLVTAVGKCAGAKIIASAGNVADTVIADVIVPPSDPATETFAASLGVNLSTMTKRSSVLYQQDIIVGGGANTVIGRTVSIRYTNWLTNGTSLDTGTLSFALATGVVISGWDQGIQGMRVGGKRRLIMGSAHAFGSSGSGAIPCASTLISDIELLSQS